MACEEYEQLGMVSAEEVNRKERFWEKIFKKNN